jgi:hypothetical protein
VLGRNMSAAGRLSTVFGLLAATTLLASCRRDATGPGSNPDNYPVVSLFNQDTEGWTAEGDGILHYSPTGGNPGGYIFIIDEVKGDNFYFVAPSRFLGNAAGAYGRLLTFDLVWFQTGSGSYKEGDDVIIAGAGRTLVAPLPNPPATSWTSYAIPLDPSGGWVHQGTDQLATVADIQAVLGSLGRLWIRGEYRHGSEQGGLDNVRFGAAP